MKTILDRRKLVIVTLVCAAFFFVLGFALMRSMSVGQVTRVRFSHPDEIVRGQGFAVLADRRMFATMAFINAMGYDYEMKEMEMHPVRVKVRETLSKTLADHPRKARKWKKYYKSRHLPVFCYLDYALSLDEDYPFRRIRPNDELG